MFHNLFVFQTCFFFLFTWFPALSELWCSWRHRLLILFVCFIPCAIRCASLLCYCLVTDVNGHSILFAAADVVAVGHHELLIYFILDRYSFTPLQCGAPRHSNRRTKVEISKNEQREKIRIEARQNVIHAFGKINIEKRQKKTKSIENCLQKEKKICASKNRNKAEGQMSACFVVILPLGCFAALPPLAHFTHSLDNVAYFSAALSCASAPSTLRHLVLSNS